MGILDKILKREEPEVDIQSDTCAHLVLTPRWDNLEDIGHEDLATSFRCESCGRIFSNAETRDLRNDETERIRRLSG